ncbi:Gfo/Idh/MocA family protein [Thermasporomyces composti]|jgi:predicted dehydrogenase|uniref:Putative dehydrogenase n=1 Tax=Thermasporomyces composti TaxID=696763 RepID=A0A3D9V816_THECX|nr:Gfo/Idh/MocA family oxidoreductase [Thermasporomyces composti]REF37932.1 putative dehydrogenase [Thermasporomyces composti]
MTVNVGLIGCGGISNPHVRGYLEIPDKAKVTAVADVVEANARARAEQVGGAQIFSDYRELIATAGVDAVDICLPHHLHADAIIAAAEAGKHILCEKPLCISTEEADKITKVVQDTGVTLMCAHNQLFMPPVAKARELIQSGALGKVYELRTTDSFFNRGLHADMGWRGSLETAGGGELIDTGYHPTYLLLHLATAEPVEVVAMTSRHRLTMEGEDSAQVLVRFADGSVGNIVTSWAYIPSSNTEKFSVVGEHGTLWSDGRTLYHRTIDGQLTTVEFPEVNTIKAEVADFISCITEGRRPLNTEVEGVHVLKVILGAYASVREKRVISLADL